MDRLNFVVSKINQHIEEIKERSKQDISTNLEAYDALAMSCLQLVNRLVDLGKMMVSEKHLGFPETYSDIFKILANQGIITKEELSVILKLIYYRNLIYHEYSNITWKELLEFRENLDSVQEVVEKLAASLKNSETRNE